jgi:hypothetical protein
VESEYWVAEQLSWHGILAHVFLSLRLPQYDPQFLAYIQYSHTPTLHYPNLLHHPAVAHLDDPIAFGCVDFRMGWPE